MIVEETDGARVRRARKRAGLTQRQLADRIGRSQAWVSGVEHDTILLDSVSLLNTLARALGIPPNEITGRPYRGTTQAEDRGHGSILEIRRQVDRYDLPPEWDGPVRSLDELQVSAHHLAQLVLHARYATAAEQAPALLAELHAAAHTYTGQDEERAYWLLADLYRDVYAVASALGYGDLAALITRNVRWAAERSGDPLIVATGNFLRARDLWGSASWSDSLTVIDRALADIAPEPGADALAVAGFGHLAAAITSARKLDPDTAWTRHAMAAEAMARLSPQEAERDRYRYTTSSANVAVHGVAIAVELGDGIEAVKRGGSLRLPAGMPAERRAHHYMDLSRGWLWYGSRERSLASMEHAERIAPMLVRNHPMAHAAVRTLLERENRAGYQERVRRLSVRMRVL